MFKEIKRNSLVFKFSFRIALILAMLLTVLITSNLYSLKVVKANLVNNAKYTMAIHINNVQNILKSASKDLSEIFENSLETISIYPELKDNQKYFETLKLKNVLTGKISSNDNIDLLFISVAHSNLILTEFNKRIPTNEKLRLYYAIKKEKLSPVKGSGSKWTAVKINGFSYLAQIYQTSNMTFGVLIKPDTLMAAVQKTTSKQNQYVLMDEGENMLYASNPSYLQNKFPFHLRRPVEKRGDKYIISEKVPEFGWIANIIETKNIFSGLAFMQWMIICLGVISLFVIPPALWRLSREIIIPVLALVKATKEVEKGNWDYQMPRPPASLEFTKLYNSFSSMIQEIKVLKINSYEEKLERNKAELKYLQMQIKPHFFLNAITTISSLTYKDKNEEIRKLIHYLSKYLRYMFKGGLVNVTIQEEMQHVENYIHLQEIKFPNQIFYIMDIDRKLEQQMLPQFLIQTFVENIFKHAWSDEEMLSIFIKAAACETKDGSFIRIVVEDNGAGFPEEIMEEINADVVHENGASYQIGIQNIKKTLKLLYKKDGLLKLSNDESFGARVDIWIPMSHDLMEEQHAVSVNR